MLFSAIGMNPPGFASVAPAMMTAIAEPETTWSSFATIDAVRAGSRGLCMTRATYASRSTAATTSSTATHVFGVSEPVAAASPSANAAIRPIPRVAPKAPT